MDIFSKLDNARYVDLKKTYLNNLQLKACDPTEDPNKIFTLANTYSKPKATTGRGLASTFNTTVDTIHKNRRRRGGKGKGNQDNQSESGDKQSRSSSNISLTAKDSSMSIYLHQRKSYRMRC
jgi:hypothetical protein